MKKNNFAKIMNTWLRSKLDNVHTILPGKIISYEGHTTRKAEVLPLVKPKTIHNVSLTIQPIKSVPVIFPSTATFNLLFPLSAGDGVLLLFTESGIGNFLNSSGTVAMDADNLNKFDLTDCIAIPGMWSFTNVPSTAINKIELDDAGKITINSTTIDLLIGANESFIKGDTFITILTPLITAISSLVTSPPSTPVVRGDLAGIQTAAATLLGLLDTAKSTLIKGK